MRKIYILTGILFSLTLFECTSGVSKKNVLNHKDKKLHHESSLTKTSSWINPWEFLSNTTDAISNYIGLPKSVKIQTPLPSEPRVTVQRSDPTRLLLSNISTFESLAFTLLCLMHTANAGITIARVDYMGEYAGPYFGPDGDGYSSLQLNTLGNPVISYCDASNYNVKLAVCDDPVCYNKVMTTIDPTNYGGCGTSLQLNSLGNPIISYSGNGNVTLAVCADPVCAHRTLVVVDSISSKGTSLQLNHLGNPVISYIDGTNYNLKLAVCDDPACYNKTLTIVDAPVNTLTYGYASLQLNSLDNPVISYFGGTNGDLKLAVCKDAMCSSSTRTTVDPTGNFNYFTSLQLNSHGNPVISYFDYKNNSIKLAVCDNAVCTNKTMTTVGFVNDQVAWNVLQLNSLDYPVISYFDSTTNNVNLAICDNAVCANKTLITIDYPLCATNGWWNALQLGDIDNPVMSYFSNTGCVPNPGYSLMMVICSNAACTPNTPSPTPDSTRALTFSPTYPTANPTAGPTLHPTVAPISNFTPKIIDIIPSQTVQANDNFIFTILASNYFTDPQGSTLSLSATEEGRPTLPSWLSFDPSSDRFTGKPTIADVGSYIIQVTATNFRGAFASQLFTIGVSKDSIILFNKSQGSSAADAAKIFGSIGGALVTLGSAFVAFLFKRKRTRRRNVKLLLLAGKLERAEKERKAFCCNRFLGLNDKGFVSLKNKVEKRELTATQMLIDGVKLYHIEEKTAVTNERLGRWKSYWKTYSATKREICDKKVLAYFKEKEQLDASNKLNKQPTISADYDTDSDNANQTDSENTNLPLIGSGTCDTTKPKTQLPPSNPLQPTVLVDPKTYTIKELIGSGTCDTTKPKTQLPPSNPLKITVLVDSKAYNVHIFPHTKIEEIISFVSKLAGVEIYGLTLNNDCQINNDNYIFKAITEIGDRFNGQKSASIDSIDREILDKMLEEILKK